MRSKTADKILKRIKERKTPYTINSLSIEITVLEDVYPPGEESIFLAEKLKNFKYGVHKGEMVLDYGCGTGFLSIIAARLGAKKVVAVDINNKAVKNTKINIKNNYVEENVEVRQGISFETIHQDEKFDIIIANLPFEEANAKESIEYAVYDQNFQMRKSLFDNAKKHLTDKGRIIFNYSERVQNIEPLQNSSKDFKYKIIAKKIIANELYIIFLITFKKRRYQVF